MNLYEIGNVGGTKLQEDDCCKSTKLIVNCVRKYLFISIQCFWKLEDVALLPMRQLYQTPNDLEDKQIWVTLRPSTISKTPKAYQAIMKTVKLSMLKISKKKTMNWFMYKKQNDIMQQTTT